MSRRNRITPHPYRAATTAMYRTGIVSQSECAIILLRRIRAVLCRNRTAWQVGCADLCGYEL